MHTYTLLKRMWPHVPRWKPGSIFSGALHPMRLLSGKRSSQNGPVYRGTRPVPLMGRPECAHDPRVSRPAWRNDVESRGLSPRLRRHSSERGGSRTDANDGALSRGAHRWAISRLLKRSPEV